MNTDNTSHDKAATNDQSNSQITASNAIKDPSDWTTGDEPMTGSQQSYLETLLGRKIEEPLTKAAASIMIEENRNKGQNAASASSNSNAVKDPDEWSSGADDMTDAQKSYIKTLSQEAGADTDTEDLSKADASKKIEELQQQTGRGSQNAAD